MTTSTVKESVNALFDRFTHPDLEHGPDRSEKPPIGQKTGFSKTQSKPAPVTKTLTETARVETSFTVASGGTVHVPLQVTMTDEEGNTYIYNFSTPTVE
jgi:hypothetical protein